ncbi:MAG TPA: hypothetical protein PKM88_09865 [bacterium]|nr:hypothetical protein [bacterium]
MLMHFDRHLDRGDSDQTAPEWPRRVVRRVHEWLMQDVAPLRCVQLLQVGSADINALNRCRLPLPYSEVRSAFVPDTDSWLRSVAVDTAKKFHGPLTRIYEATLADTQVAAARAQALAEQGGEPSTEEERARMEIGDGVVPLWSQRLPDACHDRPPLRALIINRFHTETNEVPDDLLPLIAELRALPASGHE